MRVTIERIADLINEGINNAFDEFAILSRNKTNLIEAPEYFTVVKIAESLKKLEVKKIALEQSMGQLHLDTLGRPKKAYSFTRRYDLAILDADRAANTAIEVKRNVYKSDIKKVEKDLLKLEVATSTSASDGDYKYGIFAFHTTQYEEVNKMTYEKLAGIVDDTCATILKNSKDCLYNFDVKGRFFETRKEKVNKKIAFGGGCLIVKPK